MLVLVQSLPDMCHVECCPGTEATTERKPYVLFANQASKQASPGESPFIWCMV